MRALDCYERKPIGMSNELFAQFESIVLRGDDLRVVRCTRCSPARCRLVGGVDFEVTVVVAEVSFVR